MKSTRKPIKKKNSAATWWIVGIIGAMMALALIVLTGLPGATTQRALVAGTTLGDPNAPILVEEYADFQCPACGLFARQTLPGIESKYVNTGKVRLVVHHFAFIGEESMKAAQSAECAGEQGKFWEYYDTLYANQGGENVGAFSNANLIKFADQLKLDSAAFTACLDSDKYRAQILRDTNEGKSRGVTSTPTLFINGRRAAGAISFQEFESIIGPILNSAK